MILADWFYIVESPSCHGVGQNRSKSRIWGVISSGDFATVYLGIGTLRWNVSLATHYPATNIYKTGGKFVSEHTKRLTMQHQECPSTGDAWPSVFRTLRLSYSRKKRRLPNAITSSRNVSTSIRPKKKQIKGAQVQRVFTDCGRIQYFSRSSEHTSVNGVVANLIDGFRLARHSLSQGEV